MCKMEHEVLVVASSHESVAAIERQIGFPCVLCSDVEALSEQRQAMVVLILGWEVDSYSTCAQAREHTRVPIILLTDDDSPTARIQGLNLGADFVLGRGSLGGELSARVRAVMRRSGMPAPGDTYRLLRYSTA